MMSDRMRCCVVGAGVTGLVTVKEGIARGLDITCFERDDDIAGIWRYSDDVINRQASLYGSVQMNSSKEMSGFSDFSIPKAFPNFMHHSFFNQFIRMYAEHFNLRKNICFNTDVRAIEKADNFGATGQWLVTVRDTLTCMETVKLFDYVVIAHGHENKPHLPQFKGINNFSGNVIHSHGYKNYMDFRNQRVLLVGFGHSSVEIASLLAKQADQVYISSRRGTYITTRTTRKGRPHDQVMYTRVRYFIPYQLRRYLEYREVQHQQRYGIVPSEKFRPGVKTISEDLFVEMDFGRIIVKEDVDHFTRESVVFHDKSEEKIDTVILATGYELEEHPLRGVCVLDSDSQVPNLYKLVFPTQLEPCTLAFVGMVFSIGPRAPTAELQARWATGVFVGEIPKPSVEKRQIWHEKRSKEIYSMPNPTERKALTVSYVDYIKDLAKEAGCNPNLPYTLITDPYLWYKMVFGPLTPAQWRLHGPDSNPSNARECILKVEENTLHPYKVACAGARWKNDGDPSSGHVTGGTGQKYMKDINWKQSNVPSSSWRLRAFQAVKKYVRRF